MVKWIEYTGSDEHIEEIKNAKGYVIRGIDVAEVCSQYVLGPFVWVDTSDHPDQRVRARSNLKEELKCSNVTHYLICEPHPYADIIKIWADTGCEVWVKTSIDSSYAGLPITDISICSTTKPDWNIPNAEFRLTPFDESKE